MRLVIIGAGFAGMYAALSAARLRDIRACVRSYHCAYGFGPGKPFVRPSSAVGEDHVS